MAYQACENCGTRLYGGTCSNCEEELVIYEQAPDYPFSDEFMALVDEQEEMRGLREAK
jgi:hypothetical protein